MPDKEMQTHTDVFIDTLGPRQVEYEEIWRVEMWPYKQMAPVAFLWTPMWH